MSPEIVNTYEQISQLPAKVLPLFAKHNIDIDPDSDLQKMLDRCALAGQGVYSSADKLEVCRAQRVLLAIVACSDEPEIKEPLNRIASSNLDFCSTEHSLGQDAVFELEFLQYVRHRGLTARLGEPDIIVSAPFGDYFVACKCINSLANFKGQLRSGTSQVKKLGHGCVAFNLERQSKLIQPLKVEQAKEVKAILDAELSEFYAHNTERFNRLLVDGSLDGVVLQISCFADIAESGLDLNVCTHTVFYSRQNLQGAEAHDRFDGFRQSMRGQMG